MDHERRKQPRVHANLGTEIRLEGGVAAEGITVDASDGGVLVLSRAHPKVGTKVALRILRLDIQDPPYEVEGDIARLELLEEPGLWTHRLGVRLVTVPPGLHDEIQRASDRHRELYGE